MNDNIKYKVSFRIIDDELDPAEVSCLLNIESSSSHKKGDPNKKISKKGREIEYSPFSTGLWGLDSSQESGVSIDFHIQSLLDKLEPVNEKLHILYERGYKFDIFCGVFIIDSAQPGIELDCDIIRKMADLKVSLGLCIYNINSRSNCSSM